MREFRHQRGRQYFDKFWTPGPAQEGRDFLLKYQPDLCSLSISLVLDSAFRILQPTFLSKAPSQTSTYHVPDLICQEYPYEWVFSDDTILSPVESQLCNIAALICSDSPRQALWHTRGVLRHGGTVSQAKFAQDLSFAVVDELGVKIQEVQMVEDIEFERTDM
jgi:hypothetical protein